jgi:molybdenum cofactor guanylyltransferase
MDHLVTGIVLSGGQGRRAGGADKGLLPWKDSTQIETLLKVLRPQVDRLIISANRNLERYRELADIVVSDDLADYQGPLAGVAAALALVETNIALVVPCDCPNPPADLASRLLRALEDGQHQLVYAHDGTRAQYLFCALRKNSLESLRHYLAEGGRSVKGWHLGISYGVVDFSDCPESFANHNRRQPSHRAE